MNNGLSNLLSGTRRRITRSCSTDGASNEAYVLAASSDEFDFDDITSYDDVITVVYRYYGICVVLTVCCLSAIATPLALWIMQRSGVPNPRQKVACIARPIGIVTFIVILWILYPTYKFLTYDIPVYIKILIVVFLIVVAFSWLSVISESALVNHGLGSPWGQMIFVGAEFGVFMYMLPLVIDMHKLIHDANDVIEKYGDGKTLDEITDDSSLSEDIRERAQELINDLDDLSNDLPDGKTMVYMLGGSSLLLAGSTLLLWGLLPLPPVEPLKSESDGTIKSRIKSFLCGV